MKNIYILLASLFLASSVFAAEPAVAPEKKADATTEQTEADKKDDKKEEAAK